MPYASGTGTSGDPYIITNIDHIDEIRNDLNDPNVHHRFDALVDMGPATSGGGAHYNGGDGWLPIGGSGNEYQGTLDLNGFGFENLNITRSSDLGLFSHADGATFSNGKIHGTLSATGTGFGTQSGLLVAWPDNCTFNSIKSEGLVETATSNTAEIGGIAGRGDDNTFNDCHNAATVKAPLSANRIGGIIGFANNASQASQAFRCLNTGLIDADTTKSDVNAIIGTSAGGASSDRVVNSFNDKDTSGIADGNQGDGVTNLTTAEAQSLATYTTGNSSSAWNMVALGSYVNETWVIDDGNAYPEIVFTTQGIENISGTVRLNGSAAPFSIVHIYKTLEVFLAASDIYVDTVQSDVNGNWTSTEEITPDHGYYTIVFNKKSVNIDGFVTGVNGSEITTDANLSSLDTNNDLLYVIEAVAGAGSGSYYLFSEFVDAANGVINLNQSNHGFDNTTEFAMYALYGPKIGEYFPATE